MPPAWWLPGALGQFLSQAFPSSGTHLRQVAHDTSLRAGARVRAAQIEKLGGRGRQVIPELISPASVGKPVSPRLQT